MSTESKTCKNCGSAAHNSRWHDGDVQPRSMGTEAPRKFRKKPVEIEAMQWVGTTTCATQVIDWVLGNGGTARFVGGGEAHPLRRDIELEQIGNFSEVRDLAPAFIVIDSLEGAHRMDPRDFMIRGVQGEFYACKPDIFAATYERVSA